MVRPTKDRQRSGSLIDSILPQIVWHRRRAARFPLQAAPTSSAVKSNRPSAHFVLPGCRALAIIQHHEAKMAQQNGRKRYASVGKIVYRFCLTSSPPATCSHWTSCILSRPLQSLDPKRLDLFLLLARQRGECAAHQFA